MSSLRNIFNSTAITPTLTGLLTVALESWTLSQFVPITSGFWIFVISHKSLTRYCHLKYQFTSFGRCRQTCNTNHFNHCTDTVYLLYRTFRFLCELKKSVSSPTQTKSRSHSTTIAPFPVAPSVTSEAPSGTQVVQVRELTGMRYCHECVSLNWTSFCTAKI